MIKYVKLISGEELAAEVTYLEDDKVLLKNPMKLMVAPPVGLSMLGFCNFCKSEQVTLEEKHIMFVDDLEEEIHNVYSEKFGSGILLATGGPKIELNE
jgi:hypothetical protein